MKTVGVIGGSGLYEIEGLSEVEEVAYVKEDVPGQPEPVTRQLRRGIEMIFVRGDSIILVSTPMK